MDELSEAAALGFRFVLAFILLNASVSKLLAPVQFARAVRNYRLLPTRLNQPVAAWLPRVELGLALMLLLGVWTVIAAGVTAAMLVVFATAVAINLGRGREIDCGCLTAPSPRTIGWSLVGADLGLAAMAATVALLDPRVLVLLPLGPSESSLGSEEGLPVAMLAALLVLGYLVLRAWLTLRLAVQHTRARSGADAL